LYALFVAGKLKNSQVYKNSSFLNINKKASFSKSLFFLLNLIFMPQILNKLTLLFSGLGLITSVADFILNIGYEIFSIA
jgi:hypothetical protein